MPLPSSSKYLSLASSRLSSFKGKLSQYREEVENVSATSSIDGGARNPQNWKQWAGQKIRKNLSKNDSKIVGNEEIVLFPGWAARRYTANGANAADKETFEVDVFVSGYASVHRPPELATRSQRAFLRLAKGFAALPRLASDTDSAPSTPLSRSTERLLESVQLPPRPGEITEEYETQLLEQQFIKMSIEDQDPDSGPPTPSGDLAVEPDQALNSAPPARITIRTPTVSGDPQRLHANLESRLRPFWSTALSARQIRIHLFAPHSNAGDNPGNGPASDRKPIASKDVQTAADGFFSARLIITWEEICCHPEAAHIVQDDPGKEHNMYIEVELLSPSATNSKELVPQEETAGSPIETKHRIPHLDLNSLKRSVTSTLSTPLTHSSIRVISDIDDTIKFSNILSGVRAAFHNVFVKELTETTIPGMGEWYDQMWKRGVRFHYVSNGPYELLPVVKEFLHISQLPPGSIKLKSYTGRSLFNGLMSAPASRKRAGVVEVLDSFPNSRFFLIGDTGEQDLELYASLAAERPNQIAAVFLRDASSTTEAGLNVGEIGSSVSGGRSSTSCSTKSIEDPTGEKVLAGQAISPDVELQVGNRSPPPDVLGGSYFTAGPLSSEPETYAKPSAPPSAFRTRTPSPSHSSGSRLRRRSSLPESEKKRSELQMRVWRARTQIPVHIPLRVFRRPEECAEAWEVLDRVRNGTL